MAEFTLSADETRVIQALDNIEKKFVSSAATAAASGKKIEESFVDSNEAALRAKDSVGEYDAAQAKLAARLKEEGPARRAAFEAAKKEREEKERLKVAMENEAVQRARLKEAVLEQARAARALLLATDEAAKKVVEQAQKQAKGLDNLQAKYDGLRKTAFTLGEASRRSLDPATVAKYKEQIQVLEQEMETLAAQGQKAGGSITTGLEKATIAQRAFNFVMSLNPIGIIIAALASLVNQLRKYQGVMDAASKITAQVGAVIAVVTDRAISLGKAIYSLVTLDFASFGQNMVKATDNFTGAVSNAWTAAGNLADATFALRDAQLAAALSTAKLQAASDRYRETASDETKNYNERISAIKTVIGIESELAKVRLGFAGQALANAKAEFALSGGYTNSTASREALLEKELAYEEARTESDKARRDALRDLMKLEKERADFIEKSIGGAQKLSAKIDLTLTTDPVDKEILKINQDTTDLVNAIQAQINAINEVQKLRPLNDDELALRQKLQDNIVDVIDDGQRRIELAFLEGAKRANALDDKIRADKKKAEKLKGDDARAALKDILELENQKISITEAEFANFIAMLKAQGVDEAEIKTAQLEFAKRITAQRLEAELAYDKAILGSASGKEAEILRARIQEIETILDGIDIPEPKGKDGKPKDLFELLGINFDKGQKEAFKESIAFVLDQLSQVAEARTREAEAATEAAQKKVEEIEDSLSKEQDLAKQGLANNVDLRKKELEEAKKLRDAALKEEVKAKKQQIALDTVTQSVGLITSSVNIFKSLSPLGPLGIGLAIVSIGAMFAAFAAAKAKALKAAEVPKLRKGDKIIGRTHEQGGELRELEHGEQVVGAGESIGQDVFFANMRKGKYKGLDLAAIAESRGDYQSPIAESAARTTALQVRRDKAAETMHYNAISKAYERGAEKIVDAIKKKPSYAPWKSGYKEIKQTGHGTDTTTFQPSE